MSHSQELAHDVEAKAHELAAALAVYQRMPSLREPLAVAIDLLVNDLVETWMKLLRLLESETLRNDNAQEK
jgi:hypothetical protein